MTSLNQSLAQELDQILTELKESDLSELPADRVLELRKKLNPYGRTIEGSDRFLNFSITQISHEYWKKLIVTAFIGFMNRMVDEWKVPENVPVVSVYDYLNDPTKVDTPEIVLQKGTKGTLYDYEFNREWMKKRVIVKSFLEEMFQFSPDEHVRSAHVPNRADKTRKPINTAAGHLATEHLKRTNPQFRAKEELYAEVQPKQAPQKTKTVTKTLIGRDGKQRTITKEVPDFDSDHKPTPAEPLPADLKDPSVGQTVREMIPPHDLFGRFKTYLQSNLEELRDSVNDLYCEKPEFELAINPYSWHDTQEEAETFKKKHRNEVIAEVFTAHSGKWNFFDSFKDQRENVNFYNDNTIVLEEMIKQLERDERLGQDLMKKRVEKVKQKNVIEAGPDAESFKKWRQQNSEIQKLGAQHIGDMADEDCPDDAVQVDVWRVAESGLKITKDKFYSLAEAPEFVRSAQDEAIASGKMKAPPGYVPPSARDDKRTTDTTFASAPNANSRSDNVAN